jgi:hypothetical protein
MKRLLLGVLLLGGGAVLAGCPIYPDHSSYSVCDNTCCSDSECGTGYRCSPNGCVPDPYYSPSSYDASAYGQCGYCPSGTVCTLSGGVLQCLPPGTPSGTVDAGLSVDGAGPTPVDSGTVTDAAADADGGTGSLCNLDIQCPAPGSKCIDGICTPQNHLCSDGTQCLVAGESCVDGVCLPTCGGSAPPCPAGYGCDFNRGVCSINPNACMTAKDCQGGAVCVEARCVAPCGSPDAGPRCSVGQVCINGGCIPDQQARFECQNDGNAGALANTCATNSICLHGDCYVGCATDGGTCGAGESCKSVTISKGTSQGTYQVCAAPDSLGSDCSAATGDLCSTPQLCIDGFCK